MSDEKKTGSYYTPNDLIEFMVEYLKKENQDFSSVLEPSAGDGRFLSWLLPLAKSVNAIEVFETKATQIREKYTSAQLDVNCIDFLDYAATSQKKYSLIIGNPPYISPKVMDKDMIQKAKELCLAEGLTGSIMQNMWVAFIIGACRLLEPNGTIFFVLPMEFLQVQYAEKLRLGLEKRFNTIHVLTFQSFVFSDIEQEVCLVYLTNKIQYSPYILYNIYENPISRKAIMTNTIKKNKPLKKWSNAILLDEEISLLRKRKSGYKKIKEMGEIAPGIVTGGNKYFILSESKVNELGCKEYVLPILQKSSFIAQKRIDINNDVMRQVKDADKPVYLLNLMDETKKFPPNLQNYLEKIGEEEIQGIALKKRYKCANRTPWYGVPIVKKGQVIFFKRYDELPRIYINEAGVHTTDAGYHIRIKQEIDRDSFVFCFYNSLTLAQCEYNGRYYGGGVRELIPSEFKEITIPYRNISKTDIDQLKQMFLKCEETSKIVKYVNSKTIAIDFPDEEIQKLDLMRIKLLNQRNSKKQDS